MQSCDTTSVKMKNVRLEEPRRRSGRKPKRSSASEKPMVAARPNTRAAGRPNGRATASMQPYATTIIPAWAKFQTRLTFSTSAREMANRQVKLALATPVQASCARMEGSHITAGSVPDLRHVLEPAILHVPDVDRFVDGVVFVEGHRSGHWPIERAHREQRLAHRIPRYRQVLFVQVMHDA